jgi:CheY-like chemotaxis protein
MIVREIVEAHGGEVGAESELGHGSTFWFRLPRRAEAAAPLEVARSELLIVDDDEDVRDALRFVLEAEGYGVLAAANGQEALDSLVGRRPVAIFVDLNMPVMTGWELVARLKSAPELRDIPVCVLSAVSKDAPSGVARVLQKPFKVEELLEFVAPFAPPSPARLQTEA